MPAFAGMTREASVGASWFETALARVLTMRVLERATPNDLILRSRESGVSKDGP